MVLTLNKANKAYNLLKEYKANNPYILKIRDKVLNCNHTLNSFEADYIINNYKVAPMFINRTVKITDWYGIQCQEKFELGFLPNKMKITWFIGELPNMFHLYVIFRKSQSVAHEIFVSKKAILTDFLIEDYHNKEIDFKKYNEKCGRSLYPYQEEAVKFLTCRKKAILASEMGSGKALPNSTLIPTPQGMLRMGELKPNDLVYGSDGCPHKILNVYPQGIREIYRVLFSDGTYCDCDIEHLWIVRKTNEEKWQVMTLAEIMHDNIALQDRQWEIPICNIVKMEAQDLNVDIYELGRLLMSSPSDFAKEKDKQLEIWKRQIDLNEVYIPEEYKHNSAVMRFSLLKAINGTSLSPSENIFCHASKRLVKDVQEIICSLGGIAEILKEQDGHMLKYSFSPQSARNIVKVEKIGKEEATCIHVDSEDNSYLATSNYIVTHNTMAAIVAALEDEYKKILVICPASVKMTWQKELRLLVPEDEITMVEGKNWRENKFTIINYDILKNFYELPLETIQTKELDVDKRGNVVKRYKEKTVKSRKSSIIHAAMAESQLYQSQFDLIIIDEAHRLSNTSSGIYQIVSDLVSRSKPKGIYAITGTPITNRPINFYNILKIIGAPISLDWNHYVTRYCDGKHFYKKNERNAYTAIFCKQKNKKDWFSLSPAEKNELNDFLEKKCKKIWVTDGASNLDELQEIVKPYYLRRLKSDFGKIVKKTVKVINYELTDNERDGYDNVWNAFRATQGNQLSHDFEKYKTLTEGTLLRQWLANAMTQHTINLAQKCIEKGHKVVIFCSFDEELKTIQQAFKGICVVHNGKMTTKNKEKSVERFQNDDSVRVFIGNIQSAGVGITLTSGQIIIFNSITFVPGEMLQAEDRIHRLNQTKDVTIYYQVFMDTYMEKMFELVHQKNDIINNIIVSENAK